MITPVLGSLDAATCHAQVQRLLDEEIHWLTRLETQLLAEHALLVADDIDGLDAAGGARQASVVQLLRLEEERGALCRMLGHDADAPGVRRMLEWCDPQGLLAARVQECAARSGRCREQNLRNGMLVNARLQRISQMLGIVGGDGGNRSRTYGPAGYDSTAPLKAGRFVSTMA
ncbi:MAG: hypothetical protein RL026_2156 [Pseudomonadota bacterium]|jgi:flagellar biosynthesis/type III secretory pathway chaperone